MQLLSVLELLLHLVILLGVLTYVSVVIIDQRSKAEQLTAILFYVSLHLLSVTYVLPEILGRF